MKSLIKRQFFAAIVAVLFSFIMLGGSTYAWFAANMRVTATGLQVNTVTSASLVIAKELAVGTATTVTFSAATNALTPATHDSSITVGNTLSGTATGLLYNTNPTAVSAETGFAAGSTALTFDNAINNIPTDVYYYVDDVVYIASAGAPMENTGLNAYIYTGIEITADTTRATSVDFYVSEDSANLGTYQGTLNLSNLTAAVNTNGDTYYTANLQLLDNSGTIPQNGSTTDYLKITMRIYYDGALEKSAGQAFVYSNLVTTTGTAFNVSFQATTA